MTTPIFPSVIGHNLLDGGTDAQDGNNYPGPLLQEYAAAVVNAHPFFRATGGGSGLVADGVPAPWAVASYRPLLADITEGFGLLPQFYRTATTGGRTYGHDHAGRVFQAEHGECVAYGLRRVKNLLSQSENLTNAAWTALASATVTATYNSARPGPTGRQNAFLISRAASSGSGLRRASGTTLRAVPHVFSVYLKSGASNAAEIRVYNNTGASVAATKVVTTTGQWQRFAVPVTPDGTSSYMVEVYPISQASTSSGSIYATMLQLEEKIDGSDAPSEYVSVSCGPRSRWWHGAGVDAVKYFNTDLGNTYNSSTGVVTEADGAALTGVRGRWTHNSAIQQILNNNIASGWTGTNMTATDNAAVAPDGTTTAISLNEGTTASAAHHIQRTLTGVGAIAVTAAVDDGDGGGSQTWYPFSCYVKAGTGDWMRLLVQDVGGTSRSAYFNAATGAAGTISANSGYLYIEPMADGWYRVVWIVPVYSGTGSADPLVRISMVSADNTPTYTGTSRVNYIWMPCLHTSTSTSGVAAQLAFAVPANTTGAAASTLPGQSIGFSVAGVFGRTDFGVVSTMYPFFDPQQPNKQRYTAVTYVRTDAEAETRGSTVGDLDIQRCGLTIRPPLNNSTGSGALDFYNGDPNPDYFWQASTAYSVGDYVIPTDTQPNNDNGRKVFTCVQAGTSGSSEPTWNTTYTSPPDTSSNLTTDGTVRWQCNAENDINGTFEPYSGEIADLDAGFMGEHKCGWYFTTDDYGLFINGVGGFKQTAPRPVFPSRGYALGANPKTLFLGGLGSNTGQYPEAVPSGTENAMAGVGLMVHRDVLLWHTAPTADVIQAATL